MITIPFLPNYHIVLSHRNDGSFKTAEKATAFLRHHGVNKKIGYLKLLHGSARVHWEEIPEPNEADAALTKNMDLCLTMVVSDCFPIILIDKKKQVMAMIHGGWRSLLQNIVELTVKEMKSQYQSDPKDIYAWIGPGIRTQSNTMPQPPFQSLFREWSSFIHKNGDKYHLDLVGYILASLIHSKIPSGNIFDYDKDTYQNREAFFSHRRATVEGDEDGRFIVAVYQH